MTSQQQEVLEDFFAVCDEFSHAFGEDHPEITAKVEAFAQEVEDWFANH